MNIGVFGATGQVGGLMRRLLIDRSFPVTSIRFFASERSKGKQLDFGDKKVVVEDIAEANFGGLDLALFSAGAGVSKIYCPQVAQGGAMVVDNSSAWRMDETVPLVVAGVNNHDLDSIPANIVANPNCTTMVAMMVVKPLADYAGLRSIVASTYQAVSGAGTAGVSELASQVHELAGSLDSLTYEGTALGRVTPSKFVEPVAFNVVPVAGSLVDDETDEEKKFRNETRKILGLPDLTVSCTCVRVGVFSGHSLSLNLAFERPVEVDVAREILSLAPGVELCDVPTPLKAVGGDLSLVGRVRRDETVENGLALFVSGDNLRKGAALNAVQIAELLI